MGNINTIKINEAIAFAQQNSPILKKDLAMMIWPQSREQTAATNLTNLSSGRCKSISPETVTLICKTLGVTADFLFGLEKEPTRIKEISTKKQSMLDAINLISDGLKDLKETIESL